MGGTGSDPRTPPVLPRPPGTAESCGSWVDEDRSGPGQVLAWVLSSQVLGPGRGSSVGPSDVRNQVLGPTMAGPVLVRTLV